MALYPALPLFTDAYLADTRHLTTEEHGAYLLLLMFAWRSAGCKLEDNDKTLARIAGLSPTKWRRLKPVVAQFFTVEDGAWRQKKLLAVYSDVASRVARNKANGARVGRARAAKVTKGMDENAPTRRKAPVSETAGEILATAPPGDQATKTKSKQKLQLAAEVSEGQKKESEQAAVIEQLHLRRKKISDACPDGTIIDDAVLHLWAAAGVDLDLDAVPVIKAMVVRELGRTGRAPHSLGYYRDAVLDASAGRQQAEKTGQRLKPASKTPYISQAQKKEFDPQNTDHWRSLLGDPANRFRGDYMARNWFISKDHPEFRERGLGTNPRLSVTSHIPQPVRDLYGPAWFWL